MAKHLFWNSRQALDCEVNSIVPISPSSSATKVSIDIKDVKMQTESSVELTQFGLWMKW